MKQSVRKPRTGSAKKAAGVKTSAKKKKRKKLTTEDKIRAVLVTAVLILAASVSVLAVAYVHSVKLRDEAAESGGTGTDVTRSFVPKTSGSPEEGSLTPAASAPTVRTVPEVQPLPAVNVPPLAPGASAVKPPPAANSRPAAVDPPARTAPPPESQPLPAVSLPPAGTSERPVSKGVLAFVIDDAGHNLRDLEPFLKFPGQLTIAVLPGLPHSAEAARRVRAAGKEVFLHQPMEALGGQNPGPGAIRAGMGRDEIRAIVSRNLDELWPVAGMNNHEGSRITMDDEAMETVLSVCRERGIIFLDSRTTADTAAPRAARRLGITIGERDVFVDNVQERKSMETYIDTGLRKAGQQGFAIMIGHVWSPELAPLLSDLFPALSGGGYSFFPASTTIGGAGR